MYISTHEQTHNNNWNFMMSMEKKMPCNFSIENVLVGNKD